jgi:hypothetical protein
MDYYPYNRRIMKACGLTSLPDRRTFDRRLSTISADIKERIAIMTSLFDNHKEGHSDVSMFVEHFAGM